VTFHTAVDAWVPFIILGGATIFFAARGSFFAATLSLLAVAANLFDPPIISLQGSVMLVLIGAVVQAMYRWIPTRKENG
jgi:hypothetical protein